MPRRSSLSLPPCRFPTGALESNGGVAGTPLRHRFVDLRGLRAHAEMAVRAEQPESQEITR